jgi:hypothetical protein
MLAYVVDAVDTTSPALKHVHLIDGGKWYGLHLGPYPTPAREDDPRHLPPNFYYDQEDWLRERQKGKSWTWSASRPNIVCDFCPGRARNLVSVLGAYAAICRELQTPLDYPGSLASYNSLTEVSEAALLVRAMSWIATQPQAANQAYNVTNGDLFRRSQLWQRPRNTPTCPLEKCGPSSSRLGWRTRRAFGPASFGAMGSNRFGSTRWPIGPSRILYSRKDTT